MTANRLEAIALAKVGPMNVPQESKTGWYAATPASTSPRNSRISTATSGRAGRDSAIASGVRARSASAWSSMTAIATCGAVSSGPAVPGPGELAHRGRVDQDGSRGERELAALVVGGEAADGDGVEARPVRRDARQVVGGRPSGEQRERRTAGV